MTSGVSNALIGVMNLAVRRAADKLGGVTALAELLAVSNAAVYQWINSDRPVPAERAPVIEHATGEKCEELCPAVPWALIRGRCSCEAHCK